MPTFGKLAADGGFIIGVGHKPDLGIGFTDHLRSGVANIPEKRLIDVEKVSFGNGVEGNGKGTPLKRRGEAFSDSRMAR